MQLEEELQLVGEGPVVKDVCGAPERPENQRLDRVWFRDQNIRDRDTRYSLDTRETRTAETERSGPV